MSSSLEGYLVTDTWFLSTSSLVYNPGSLSVFGMELSRGKCPLFEFYIYTHLGLSFFSCSDAKDLSTVQSSLLVVLITLWGLGRKESRGSPGSFPMALSTTAFIRAPCLCYYPSNLRPMSSGMDSVHTMKCFDQMMRYSRPSHNHIVKSLQ